MSTIGVAAVLVSAASGLVALFFDRLRSLFPRADGSMPRPKESVQLIIQAPGGKVTSVSGQVSPENAKLLSSLIEDSSSGRLTRRTE